MTHPQPQKLEKYSILRINRTFFKVQNEEGRMVEICDVSFTEIFKPILAASPLDAFTHAQLLYPTFHTVMAVQPTKEFRASIRPPTPTPRRNPNSTRSHGGKRRDG